MEKTKNIIIIIALPLLIFALFDIAARLWGLPKVPTSTEVKRNPLFRRCWPEYLNAQRTHDHRVIVISNSQGYGREVNPEEMYTTLLQKRLREVAFRGFDDWVVENWSLPGGNFPEFEILAAKAATIPAQYVIISFYVLNLKPRFIHSNISYFLNDTPRLLLEPGVWHHLTEDYRQRHVNTENVATQLLMKITVLPRFKEYFFENEIYSRLKRGKMGREAMMWLTGKPQPSENWRYDPALRRDLAHRQTNFKKARVGTLFFDDKSMIFIKETIAVLRGTSKRLILVSMPLSKPLVRSFTPQSRFAARASALCRQFGAAYWDATTVLPGEEFITFSHLNATNHRNYARYLAESLQRDARRIRE